jgi:putative ABC transport system permease protein
MTRRGIPILSRLFESARLAVDSIRVNKTRSTLTIFGIVVGVAVVVMVAALLQGAQNYIVEASADLAPDVIRIEKASFQDFGADGQAFVVAQSKRPDLLSPDIAFLQDKLGSEFIVGAEGTGTLPARRGSKTLVGISVQGVTPGIEQLTNFSIARGRGITEIDERFKRNVCVIGQDVADELFTGSDPLGQELRLGQVAYEVIGIAESQGSVFGNSQDGFVKLPLSTFEKIFGRRSRSISILVKALDGDRISPAETEERVRVAMRIRRRLVLTSKEDDFSIVTADSVQAFAGSLTGLVGTIIYPLTVIALFVGGVVVMNMMLASVTERTREIGIRKALGARRSDILTQVLVESTTLTVIGGLIGLATAVLLVLVIRLLTGFPIVLPVWSVFLAVGVSCAVGIVFGVVPARKAAALDPIEALRFE